MSGLEDDTLQALIQLGLTSRQARVFLAITQLGPTDIKNVAKKADVNREDIYRIMEQLAEFGIAEKTISAPMICRALPIRDATTILLERLKEKYEKANEMANRLIEKPEKRKQVLKQYGFALVTKEKAAICRILESINAAESKLDIISRFSTVGEDWSYYEKATGRALSRGVMVRLIAEFQGAPTPKAIHWGMEKGSVAVRLVPSVITERTMIINNKEAYITVSGDPRVKQRLWSDNVDFVNVIQAYFDMLWAAAKEGN
jgi:sugar-specific transcriptional regulator TrmB